MIGTVSKPSLVIVSPALAGDNNGNWQTARRWQHMLSTRFQVRIVREWHSCDHAAQDAAMIALHARRSAASIHLWSIANPGRGLAVVLTGTDLYRDIRGDATAQRSLELANVLVVLQDQAARSLAPSIRDKARVIYPSTTLRRTLAKTRRHLRAVMVGHLRSEKSPQTLFKTARELSADADILIDHIGAALESGLAEEASATMRDCPNYRWLGALPHEEVRRRIQRAHVLVHPSVMEGGAHVIMEALCCGTPVLASRVAGNVGMLGEDYGGYFELGDSQGLAHLLGVCRDGLHATTPSPTLLQRLARQCEARVPLFDPSAEKQALYDLCSSLTGPAPSGCSQAAARLP